MVVPHILIILVTTLSLTLYLSAQARRAQLDDLRLRLLDEAVLLADNLWQPLAVIHLLQCYPIA